MSKPGEMNKDLKKSNHARNQAEVIDYQAEEEESLTSLKDVDYSIILSKPHSLYKSLKLFLFSEAISIGVTIFFKLVMFNGFLRVLEKLFGTQFIDSYLKMFNTLKLFAPTVIDMLQITLLIVLLLEYLIFLLNPNLFKECVKAKKAVQAYYANPDEEDKPDILTFLLSSTFVANSYKLLKNFLKEALNITDPVYKLPTSLRFTIQVRIIVEILVCIAISIIL